MKLSQNQAGSIVLVLMVTVFIFGLPPRHFHGTWNEIFQKFLPLVACITASLYALYLVRCNTCGEHWLFKAAKLGSKRPLDYKEKIMQGQCPFCGGRL